MNSNSTKRIDYWRQLKWYNPDKENTNLLIVGVGAIGSLVAVGAAKLGVKKVTLVDFDDIEDHNFPNQFYPPRTGKKVFAVREEMLRQNPYMEVIALPSRIEKLDLIWDNYTHIVVSVDNVDARIFVYSQTTGKDIILIDPSTGGLFGNVVSVKLSYPEAVERYVKYLDGMKNVSDEEECTAVHVIFTGYGVAGEVLRRITSLSDEKYLHTFHDFIIGQQIPLEYVGKEEEDKWKL